MKQLFENGIKTIEELILIRTKQIELLTNLDKMKDSTALQFKIKYYKVWINLLRGCINKGVDIKNKSDITALKLTKKLEEKLMELFETQNLKYLEEARNALLELEQERKNASDNNDILFSSVNSHASIGENIAEDSININNNNLESVNTNDKKNNKIKKISASTNNKTEKNITSKQTKTDNETIGNTSTVDNSIDTSKIEAQPKILAEETRPQDPRGAAIFDLRYIYGIGPKNAEKLVDTGMTLEAILEDWTNWIRLDKNNAILMPTKMQPINGYTKQEWESLPEERRHTLLMSHLQNKLKSETKHLAKLNGHQLLGVKYFHDMSQKIPRDEVQRSERILKVAASHMNSELQVTLCGSYRRGRLKSGDIDCLITHPKINTMEELDSYPINILSKFVELLTNLDFLIDHLTDYGRSKYMGFCIIKQQGKKTNIARRIDIRFIPYNSYGAAILYFTGSKNFNTKMRSWALGHGYSLNEYGLKRTSDNTLISCKTEEEVFAILNYPYKKPEERDI
jgi:DNA polymerase/3'-5' exonuclease PolX